MSHTLSLYRLQQIDTQIDRLQARLETILKTLDDDAELRQLNEQIKVAEAHRELAEKTLKQAEELVQGQHIKIEQTQSSLYGAKAHSPKELLDLQKDVISLKRHLTTLEDQQIEAMMECEAAEAGLKYMLAQRGTAQKVRAEENKSLLKEKETHSVDLERLFIERNAVAGAIPPTELSLYSQLRQHRRGIAVAVISENSCGACGSNLSLAQIQTARSSDHTAHCPSCGRILYGS